MQLDGVRLPGCAHCECETFDQQRSCPHLFYALNALDDLYPTMFNYAVPDVSQAVDPSTLLPQEVYWFMQLPSTYSPSDRGGRTYAEVVVQEAEACIALGCGEHIADHLRELAIDYLFQCGVHQQQPSEMEVTGLSFLLASVGFSESEIEEIWRLAAERDEAGFLALSDPSHNGGYTTIAFARMIAQRQGNPNTEEDW